MKFSVNLSKRNNENFYLPGQEIKISHGLAAHNGFSSESDNVLTCRTRTWITMLVFAALYSILGIRVSYICLHNGINVDTAITDKIAQDDEFIHLTNPVKRADILDRNGEIIATSLPTYILQANTYQIKNPEQVAEKLHEIFPDMSTEFLTGRLKKKNKGVYIRRNLSPEQKYQVNVLGIPGLEFSDYEKRIYPHDNLFAHILGTTNIDNEGSAGLEKFMDSRLTTSTKPLQLSVDLGVQNTIREELKAGLEKYGADHAAAILMEVNTGKIISMVSYPDFDPNKGVDPNDEVMFNFATNGVYEAGSVFKVFNTALCLDSGKVDVDDRFDTSKPIYFSHNARVSDPHGSHKKLTPEDILVESSNIGSTLEIMQVGKEAQKAFLKKINMDKRLDSIELVEKAKPLFPNDRNWNDHKMATISYGYGISSTPLHIISAFSAVVNGGIYHEPTLLAEGRHDEKRVVSEKTSEEMRQLLRAVVVRGSGRPANVGGYQVFGKTGTADKLVNGKYDHKKSISTFVSGFPATNPKYALLVVLDNPKGIKETFNFTFANWNAAPISANIISAVAPQLNVKADFDLETQKNVVDAAYRNEL